MVHYVKNNVSNFSSSSTNHRPRRCTIDTFLSWCILYKQLKGCGTTGQNKSKIITVINQRFDVITHWSTSVRTAQWAGNPPAASFDLFRRKKCWQISSLQTNPCYYQFKTQCDTGRKLKYRRSSNNCSCMLCAVAGLTPQQETSYVWPIIPTSTGQRWFDFLCSAGWLRLVCDVCWSSQRVSG